MDAIILFSHGSLLCGAGEALKVQAARLRERGLAPVVEVGYLNYSDPPFADTVESVVREGATRILVTPYFLIPGKFVKVDLPRAVATAQAAHPDVTFVVANAIGFDPRLADALIDSARRSFGPARWREDLAQATRHCRPNVDCPLYDTPLCPLHPGAKEFAGVDTWRRIQQAGQEPAQTAFSPSADSASYTAAPSANTALLVMIHGSPRPVANEDMFQVVEIVKERGVFPIVQVGFMECNAPTIPEAIAACVAQGASEVIAVPYFLHTGTHVADDLPMLLEEGHAQYPDVAFTMGAYLGRSERLTDILADRVRSIQ